MKLDRKLLVYDEEFWVRLVPSGRRLGQCDVIERQQVEDFAGAAQAVDGDHGAQRGPTRRLLAVLIVIGPAAHAKRIGRQIGPRVPCCPRPARHIRH